MNDLKDTSRRLEEELRLLRVVAFRHYNQHRRCRYFVAFRSILRLSRGVCLRVNSILGKAGGVDGGISSTMVSSAISFCSSTALRMLLLSKDVASRQQGAAFAGLMAILLGGSASCLMLVLRLRDILRSPAISDVPSGALSASTRDASVASSSSSSFSSSMVSSSASSSTLPAAAAANILDCSAASLRAAAAPTAIAEKGASKAKTTVPPPPPRPPHGIALSTESTPHGGVLGLLAHKPPPLASAASFGDATAQPKKKKKKLTILGTGGGGAL